MMISRDYWYCHYLPYLEILCLFILDLSLVVNTEVQLDIAGGATTIFTPSPLAAAGGEQSV